jgi:hypothetical protein
MTCVHTQRRTNALCPQSPGAARLEIFANDILRPPGRYARRRDRLGNQGVQKVGISTVDLTPKGARAQIASREMGGAVVRTPKNGQGLSICTVSAYSVLILCRNPASQNPLTRWHPAELTVARTFDLASPDPACASYSCVMCVSVHLSVCLSVFLSMCTVSRGISALERRTI